MAVEGVLINGVTEILNNLLPVEAQEICLSWGVIDELKKLRRTFEAILPVLTDAERRRATQESVRLWLRRLKEVAYDAEDVIDEFSCDTLRRREDRLKHKVLDLVSSSNPLTSHFKMARRIKGVNKKLDEIGKYMERFQFRIIPRDTVTRGESSERPNRQTTYLASQEQIVGREEDKDKLIKILTTVTASSSASPNSSDLPLDKIPVVSIVGMGGLGKTTLAQLVFNDDSIKRHFETKIWVCVSDEFDVYKVLSDIMEFITEKKFIDLSNSKVLMRKVREQLYGKRYLLVLDDLWNEDADQWDRFFRPLIVGSRGSKILTTTRKRQVADVMKGSISPYFLEILQADECWSIMERKAFSPGGARKTPVMINIGKEIANNCGGLPLAAKFLGSVMHSKNNESNWLSIRDNDMGNTPENKIIAILKLSYDNLSPQLQRCFSYCSIFPKYLQLNKRTLIQLWMAEGFLRPSNVGNDCSLEDIGDGYFESLRWSSFLYGVKKNELDDVMTFKVHDLVHDLAKAVIGDHECSTVKDTDQLENNPEVRRFNLMVDKKFSASTKTIRNIKKLRTLILLEPNSDLDLLRFSSNKHLRILHLGHPSENTLEVRYRTSKLKQLRYFHMSSLILSSGNIIADDSFSRLCNLQTLVLSGCGFFPNLLKGMRSLKHLDISFTAIQELPDSVTSLHNLQSLDLNHCKNLTTFPDSVVGLEHLRFLDMSFTPIEKIPDFVTSLCHLETLDVNTCTKLKALPECVAGLRNLSIFNFKNCPLVETLPNDFGVLSQLRYLSLEGTLVSLLPLSCTNLHNLEYVDLFLCELPKEVTSWIKLIKFFYYMKRTPMGIGKLILLQNLTYNVREKVKDDPECDDGIEELANLNFLVELNICYLENVKNPIDAERANLKGKHNLRALGLIWVKEEEESGSMIRWDQSSCNFQVFEALQPPTSLEVLGIYNLMFSDLPTWMCVPSGTLPNLDTLILQNCREIQQLPASIGQLPRLRFLNLERMSLKSLDVSGFPSILQLKLKDMFLLEELCYSYPPCLPELWITGCKSLTEIPQFPSLTKLVLEKVDNKFVCSVGRSQPSLTELYLENIEDLVYFPISIFLNNCNLQTLKIEGCNQLEGFGVKENENRVSLGELEFIHCPVLKLPDLQRWTSLRKLRILNCPQVKTSLTYDLKSLTFLKYLAVDFIQRDDQLGDASVEDDLINLLQ